MTVKGNISGQNKKIFFVSPYPTDPKNWPIIKKIFRDFKVNFIFLFSNLNFAY